MGWNYDYLRALPVFIAGVFLISQYPHFWAGPNLLGQWCPTAEPCNHPEWLLAGIILIILAVALLRGRVN